jgi:hypothetical protein
MIVRVLAGLLAALLSNPSAGAADPKWSLPDTPQAVVLELQYSDSREGATTTALQLHRDGTFTGDAGTGRQTSGRLAPAELSELMAEVIETCGALRLTTEGLREQVLAESRRTGKPVEVRAASEMIVRLALADRRHTFQCAAPEVLHARYPNVRDLERVCAIRRRLENVAAVARVGGGPAADRLAALATEELRRHNGSTLRVTARDLLTVRGESGDLRQSQFVVRGERSGSWPAGEVHISILELPGAPPRISITQPATPL